MDDRFRGFSSETFTLKVGPEAKELFVPKDILVQIPWDPQAVANVIYFVYTNQVKKLDRETPTTMEEVQRVDIYVQAYIAADKFMAERTANRLLDEFFDYHRHKLVCPKVIARFSAAGLENSSPYNVFIGDIAYNLKHVDYPEDTPNKASHSNMQYDWEGVCAQLEKEDLLRMIVAFKRVKYSEQESMEEAFTDRCIFHKHDLTEKCKPTETAAPASERRKTIK